MRIKHDPRRKPTLIQLKREENALWNRMYRMGNQFHAIKEAWAAARRELNLETALMLNTNFPPKQRKVK